MSLLATPSRLLLRWCLSAHRWLGVDDGHQLLECGHQVGGCVVPLLGVWDCYHVLLTDVAKSLDSLHRQVHIKVHTRWLVRVLGRQDNLDRELLLGLMTHDGSLEHQVVRRLFTGEGCKKMRVDGLEKSQTERENVPSIPKTIGKKKKTYQIIQLSP